MANKKIELEKKVRERWQKIKEKAKNSYVVQSLQDCFSVHDCAFCQEYHPKYTIYTECFDCPIYKKTGESFCRNTPYEVIIEIMTKTGNIYILEEAIDEEIEFLESCYEFLNQDGK